MTLQNEGATKLCTGQFVSSYRTRDKRGMNTFDTDTGGVLRLAGRVLRHARVVSGVLCRPQGHKSEERREVVEVRRDLHERQRAGGGFLR